MMNNKNPLIIILALGALTTISPLSIDMYLSSFQQLAVEFDTTVAKISLSLSSYFIGLALGQIFYGPLLDRYGRKPPLYFGLGVYICASIACAYMPTLELFIACRLLQALGGCVAGVASSTMVSDFFPEEERAKIFSILMLILSVSPLFAPTMGGIISSYWGWKTIFILLAVIVLIVISVVHFVLPDPHTPDMTVSLNPKSILKVFIEVFREPQFFTFALSGAFAFASLFVFLAGSPAIFLKTFGVTEKQFGAIFAFLTVGMVGGGQFNIFLLRTFKQISIYKTSQRLQLAIGILFLIGAIFDWYGMYAHLIIIFLYLSCIGLIYPNAATLAVQPFKRNRGSAAALLGFLQMGAGAIASAIFGLLNLGPSVSMGILFVISASSAFLFFHFNYKPTHK